MNDRRKKAEALIYKFFDAIDPTKANTQFYKEMFSKMNDDQFLVFCKRRLPFRVQTTVFERELNPSKCINALKAINVPILEKITDPDLYTRADGTPVNSTSEGLVGYINVKKLKQFNTKKSGYNTNIDTRNPKTGQIVGNSKGIESDREIETLVLQNMDDTLKELTRAKGDDMEAKNKMYNQINTTGQVSLKDLESSPESQVARNTVDVYLISSGLMSNLLEQDYMTPYTRANKSKRIEK